MVNCCVPFCSSNSLRDTVSFHEIPVDLARREKWAKAIPRKGPKEGSLWIPLERHSVCGKHFLPSDYKVTCKYRILKKDAVPSVFPSNPKCMSSTVAVGHQQIFKPATSDGSGSSVQSSQPHVINIQVKKENISPPRMLEKDAVPSVLPPNPKCKFSTVAVGDQKIFKLAASDGSGSSVQSSQPHVINIHVKKENISPPRTEESINVPRVPSPVNLPMDEFVECCLSVPESASSNSVTDMDVCNHSSSRSQSNIALICENLTETPQTEPNPTRISMYNISQIHNKYVELRKNYRLMSSTLSKKKKQIIALRAERFMLRKENKKLREELKRLQDRSKKEENKKTRPYKGDYYSRIEGREISPELKNYKENSMIIDQ